MIFLYRAFIHFLNWRSAKNPIPENVKDIFDEENYARWRRYHNEKCRFEMLESSVMFAISLAAYMLSAHAWFASLFPKNVLWGLLAVVLFAQLLDLFDIPFSYYETMKIEGDYGFNKSTPKTFFADKVKEFIFSVLLLFLISFMFYGLHSRLGNWIVLAFAGALTAIMLLIAFLFPVFSKIFNKFVPLEDGELKEKLTAMLEKNGYKVNAIKVMDASRRTTKMNAYFSGFGKLKTIVLYDNLKNNMDADEICAVFAHEMGHGIHKDTLKNQLMTFLKMLILSFFAWITVSTPGIFTDFGFSGVNYGFALMLILEVEYAFVSPVFGLLTNHIMRKQEFIADEQAVKEGYGDALVSALKKLAGSNYSNLSPDPMVVKLEHDHPTLSQRFAAIDKLQGNTDIKAQALGGDE